MAANGSADCLAEVFGDMGFDISDVDGVTSGRRAVGSNRCEAEQALEEGSIDPVVLDAIEGDDYGLFSENATPGHKDVLGERVADIPIVDQCHQQ